MKKVLIGLIAGIILTTGVFAELSVLVNPYPILFNGQPAEVAAYNINGRTFLALGDVAKYFNATAKLNETTKEIEITANTSNAASNPIVATPTLKDGNTLDKANMVFDPFTGLPEGAEYIDNIRNNREYKTIAYNGKIYISENDLRKIYGIEYTIKNTFVNQKTKKYITINPLTDSFSVKGSVYNDFSLFSELIGE